MKKCEFKDAQGNPVTIKPDGINSLDACMYEEVKRLKNVTISILQCKNCGHTEIAWIRQEDTEEI